MSNSRKKESKMHAFLRRALETSKAELLLLLVVLVLLIVLLAAGLRKKGKSSPEKNVSPTVTASAAPTASTGSPTAEPTNEPTATPTPTVYVYGACESVTKDTSSAPVPGDGWKIDYLMLVNWDNRLVYSGNPENLVRLSDALDSSLYHLQDPVTVAKSELDYVIENDDDNYCRGNAVAVEALDKMCRAVMEQGCTYVKISQTGSYRNYATQERFWQNRLKDDPHYGDNPYKTLPRCVPGNASEHRTGLGFDVWLGKGGDDDASYKWLTENCYRYGFILRYPSDKTKITGIQYERWHYRYVGVDAATEIHELGMCLEEYIAYKNGDPIPDGNRPTPTPTPTLTPTPTVDPEDTPTPTPTGKPEDTPTPTPTGKPEDTPTPTPTGKPEDTPTPTPTGKPEDTPTPTPTGKPTDTPTPTPDTKPTDTPTPTPEANPTDTPTPTPEANPTDTPTPTLDPNDWGEDKGKDQTR